MTSSRQNQSYTLSGKTVIITGANRGVGRSITEKLAKMGAMIFMACRSTEHAESVKVEIEKECRTDQIKVMELDLVNRDSIRDFSYQFIAEKKPLDILINNAGVYLPKRTLTKEGVEMTFAINVLGHHLLTRLLTDSLCRANAARIINVASEFAGDLDLDDIQFERRTYNGMTAYKQTKQANRMLNRRWAEKLKPEGITVNSMTPDFIPSTALYRHLNPIMKSILRLSGIFSGYSVEHGADTAVWLATSPEVGDISGGFFRERRLLNCIFEDRIAEEELWQYCETLLNA